LQPPQPEEQRGVSSNSAESLSHQKKEESRTPKFDGCQGTNPDIERRTDEFASQIDQVSRMEKLGYPEYRVEPGKHF
jgi:hypothetical protein